MAQTFSKEEAEQILGLTGSYTLKDMQAAYRQKIRRAHPDVGGSVEEATRINAAKEILESLFAANKDRVVTCGPITSGYSQASQTSSASSQDAPSTARTEEAWEYSSTWSEEDWQTEPEEEPSEKTYAEIFADILRARRERKAAKPPLMARTWFVCTLFYFIGTGVIGPCLLVGLFLVSGIDLADPQVTSATMESLGVQLTVLVLFCNIAPIVIGKRVARRNQEKFYSSW